MQKRRKSEILVIVLAVVLAGSLALHVFVIRDASGGTVFWRQGEAYLFLGLGHTGYNLTYFQYPFAVFAEYFNVVRSPSNQGSSLVVLHVTPTSVERQFLKSGPEALAASGFVTPFEDGFYAICEGAQLCKWTGQGYRPATREERQRIGGETGLASLQHDRENGFVSGWHVRNTRYIPGDRFEANIGQEVVISVENRSNSPTYPWICIDLQRRGQATEKLYDVNGAPRRVGKAEYRRTFEQ
jgi:hypothetical protein